MTPLQTRYCAALILLLVLLLPARDSAAGPATVKDGDAVVTTGPLVTDTTIPQAKGTFSLYIPSFLAVRGGNFNSGWGRVNAEGRSTSLTVKPQLFYGIADRTEVNIVVPYQHNWASNVKAPGASSKSSANDGGLGDITLELKYLLLQEGPDVPAVSGQATVGFPTGKHRTLNPSLLGTDLLGSGAYALTAGFNIYKRIGRSKLYGNLWYTHFTDAVVNGLETQYRDSLTFNLAAEHPIASKWIFLSELLTSWDGSRPFSSSSGFPPQNARLSILPAVEFIAGDEWSFAAGIQADLLGKNVGYYYTPIVAVFCNF